VTTNGTAFSLALKQLIPMVYSWAVTKLSRRIHLREVPEPDAVDYLGVLDLYFRWKKRSVVAA